MSGNLPGGRIEAALQLSGGAQNRAVFESWQRCEERFGLAHNSARRPEIMPESQTRHLRDRNGRLYHHAQDLVRTLYRKIDASGYAVFLTDQSGVILDSVAAHSLLASFRTNGLLPGAVWSEEREGTNGIGTCIVEGRPITIHKDEHFLAQHAVLTCTAAPVYGPDGTVCSVLDVSAVRDDIKRKDCLRVRGMVGDYADALERILFFDERGGDVILHLHPEANHVGSTRDALISFGPDGRISGATSTARRILSFAEKSGDVRDVFEMDFDALLAKFADTSSDAGGHATAVNIAGGGVLFGRLTVPKRLKPSLGRRSVQPVYRSRQMDKSVGRMPDKDPALRRVFDIGTRLYTRHINLLMSGETGSGKEYLARHIHEATLGKGESFVAINCAALPEGLIENELFGHASGAFTGAARDGFGGRIRQANGGTLFLDEIGDMPLSAQGRLLRVLESRTVEPLGSTKSVPVDFRLICASNVDLHQAVADGRFREDLLYRIKGARLAVPALRERSDINDVIARLLADVSDDDMTCAPDVMDVLCRHDWPGNVRELINVVQYACALAQRGVITCGDLPDDFNFLAAPHRAGIQGKSPHPQDTLDQAEADALMRILHHQNWHISNTARALGIGRNTLYRRMKRLGVSKS
ncbi:sigma-54-dependent Fis family transcriptional regulator [Thalassospira sp. MA62]|nr:sigma-54-dependent Fis family transcriptional regulator [Thalassospira sp. MA62]